MARLLGWLGVLMLAVLPRPGAGQGVIGGSILSAGGTVPASSVLSISIVPTNAPANVVTFPGAVNYQAGAVEGTFAAAFSRFPSTLELGQILQVVVRDTGAGTSSTQFVTIVALDAAHLVNIVLSSAPDPSVRISSVSAPANILAGQRGVQVSFLASNSGGQRGAVSGAGLRFSSPATDRASDYTVTAASSNPTSIGPGQTGLFQFTVDASPVAATGRITIDARLDQDLDGANTPAEWTLVRPPAIRLLDVRAPATVTRGQRSVAVSVLVTNSGGSIGSTTGARLLFAAGQADRSADYQVSSDASNPVSLDAGRSVLLGFSVDVAATATTGPIRIDARLAQDPDGADAPAAWSVEVPAAVRIARLLAPAVVSRGQRRQPVQLEAFNAGGRPGTCGGARLVFTAGGVDRTRDYGVTPASLPVVTLAPGERRTFDFEVAVDPLAVLGAIAVDGRLDQDPDGADIPARWEVVPANLCPVARAGAGFTVVVTAPTVDVAVRLSGHDSADPDRPTSAPGLPTLAFAWRLADARAHTGEPMQQATPFRSGSISRIEDTGNPEAVDPQVRLLAPGIYRFGLVVSEAGAPGPANAACSSSEAFIELSVRHLPRGGQRPPAAVARALDPSTGLPLETLLVDEDRPSGPVRLAADEAEFASPEDETPTELLSYRWEQLFDLSMGGPTPPAALDSVFSARPFFTPALPGVYRFAVRVTDDGRPSREARPSSGQRQQSLQSNAVTVVVRPKSNTFPVVLGPTATTTSGSPVSFASPAVIPASASTRDGGFPQIVLEADATDRETARDSLVFTWRAVGDNAPEANAALTALDSRRALFVPAVSGLYRFEVVVFDGQLSSSRRIAVPVDDLRPGGRIGVTPGVNGLPGSADTLALGVLFREPASPGWLFGPVVLDATGSADRSPRYGLPASPVQFYWTQTAGPAELSFDPLAGELVLDIPSNTSGTFDFELSMDNGRDAVTQQVSFGIGPSLFGPSGCGLSIPSAPVAVPLDALVLAIPTAFVAVLRRRRAAT